MALNPRRFSTRGLPSLRENPKPDNLLVRFPSCLSLAAILLFLPACPREPSGPEASTSPRPQPAESVSIVEKPSHYEITLDYGTGVSRREMGAGFGSAIIARVAEYPALVDSYIRDTIVRMAGADPEGQEALYGAVLSRAGDISLPPEHAEEMEGLASELCDADENAAGDGRLSRDELYFLELILDAGSLSQCSAVSVFGGKSATGRTITGRVLDWYGGESGQLPKLQAVTTILDGSESVVLLGYLGLLTGITVANDDGLFAAILESTSNGLPTTAGKRSYAADLRYAMETRGTLTDVAAFMASNPYVAGHLVFLSDAQESAVLENDLDGYRTLRRSGSALRNGVDWGIADAIACVNSFLLEGNFDNHADRPANAARWASILALLGQPGSTSAVVDIIDAVSFHSGQAPALMSDGDLYNASTQQIVVIEPGARAMEVFFRPKDDALPAIPIFETIPLSF